MEQRRDIIPSLYVQHELGVDPLHPMKDVVEGTVNPLPKEEEEQVKQNSHYAEGDRPRIDNNKFFEERSNPLSSKGN